MRGNRPRLPRNHIHHARLRKGYTLQYVAMKCGVSREAARKWETGDAHPSAEHYEILVDLLGISPLAPGPLN